MTMTSSARQIFLALLLAMATLMPAHAQMAIRADTVYTMADAPVLDGVVLVNGTTIEAVGTADDLTIPDGYETLDATVVTPGLIDARGTVGVSGIYNVPADQDQLDTSAPIQPELRAIDAYNPQEELVAFVRSLGVTTVHTGHAPGALVSGQTATFTTHGRTVDDALRDSLTAVAMTLGPQAGQRFESPGTRAKSVAMLRSTLLDAQAYVEKQDAGDEVDRDLGMEILAKVLRGEVPALITAHRAHDIQAALRLQREFGFRLLLDGAAEAYLLTDEIKDADVPVILHPTMMRPYGPAENAAFTTAGVLHEAGIPVAIQSGWEPYVPKTRIVLFEAAIAAAHGLPREAALASITRHPAQILGYDDLGTLEAGQRADLVLFDGDPFEYTTHACTVIAAGQIVDETCK
jgi:imidazolonepropionase-like amidohydrolase